MKKVKMFLAGALSLLLMVGANAQSKSGVDYFTGKWHVVAESAPGGGSDMTVVLERKDGKLAGTIRIGDSDAVNFTKIEEKETVVKLYFISSNNNDVSLKMEKKDNDNIVGEIETSVMGNFPVTGERIKEDKK